MTHATVKVGGYNIPLIGIPQSAVLDECDLCHDTIPCRELHWSPGNQLLCPKCRAVENNEGEGEKSE